MSDHNECPTCTQDWVANTDYECGCCGRPASEHIRVTSLCRILRETQQREHKARALADRLANCLNNLWHHHSLTEASYDYIDEALAAWKEARSE